MTIERRVIDAKAAQWRFQDEGNGVFEGYLSIFDVTDTYGTRMRPGCWRAGGLDTGARYPLLDMHNSDSVVTSCLGWFQATEDTNGLLIRGEYLDTPVGQAARAAARAGVAPELSVGFVRKASDPDDAKALTACELVEGSQIIKGFASTPGAELVDVRTRTDVERRAWPPVVGSFEETTWKLRDAARAWAVANYGLDTDADDWWVGTEATFTDSVIVVIEQFNDEPSVRYYRFPYTIEDGEVVLGNPVEVEVVSDVVPRSYRPTAEHRRKLAAARLALAG